MTDWQTAQATKATTMSDDTAQNTTVILRIHRFTPKPETERTRRRPSSPFGNKSRNSNPFASSRPQRGIKGNRFTQDYTIQPRPGQTVLDCLLSIKRDYDPTLAFRYSCGHGVCGSDAVSINGTPTLLCTAKVEDYAKSQVQSSNAGNVDEGFRHTGNITGTAISDNSRASQVGNTEPASVANRIESHLPAVIEIAPLPGFPVLHDLIVDIDRMMEQITRLQPHLEADGKLAKTSDGKIDMFEYLQHPEELKRYELLSNCISCGICEGSCPVYAGGEAFVGPAALVATSRFVNDSRDRLTGERLDAIATDDGIIACQSVRACSRKCPRGIDVGEEMWQLTEQVKSHQS
jgi:succinate dehydrogenase / fumarate reductase, iron-sulfur subunit